jgi:acetolactate synthase-1/2/3 large subunit
MSVSDKRCFKECPKCCNTPNRAACPVYIPDFVKWAESYGVLGIIVPSRASLDDMITRMDG